MPYNHRAAAAPLRGELFGVIDILALTIVMGTLMYLIEGGESGFSSIPTSVYWAVVTAEPVRPVRLAREMRRLSGHRKPTS